MSNNDLENREGKGQFIGSFEKDRRNFKLMGKKNLDYVIFLILLPFLYVI